MDSIIKTEGLSKRYRDADFLSLDNLNLDVDRGEVFGILGPNGAGKTTLISILCGLLPPTAGGFEIDGLHFSDNSFQIKKTIGVVPQEHALYPTLTATENLVYFGAMYGLRGDSLKKSVAENLEYLGLSKFANKRIETFSGGMKRRVNLIAGILHSPKVLFLDEPTVGVDVHSKNAIMEYLKSLNQKGTTIIYTSHHLSEAEDFCTHIAIIDHGKIIAKGTPRELIANIDGANSLEDVFMQMTGNALRDVL